MDSKTEDIIRTYFEEEIGKRFETSTPPADFDVKAAFDRDEAGDYVDSLLNLTWQGFRLGVKCGHHLWGAL